MAERHETQSREAVATCWSCKGPVARALAFCEVCGAVQPPHATDHFERLGLERGFGVDEGELSRRYFALQARLHPDRFAGKSAKERAASLAQATALNESYQVLRDPLARAAYLLQLAGVASPTEESTTLSDPELLMESVERREELASAETAEEVSGIAQRADADARRCVDALGAAFGAEQLGEAARIATRLKYLMRLSEEARARGARLRENAAC
ncbi:MAG: Fe-S protein assembly co-chaperone HscB [Acidobacteriia bacterium]|nr:Fe-S protein assembly co-chaperone HscB [Terriglobia bacterium]